MNLALQKVVQNYYELHGSFSGIATQLYYPEVVASAKEDGRSPVNQLYAMLGYKECGGLSTEGIQQLRKAYSRKDIAAAEKLLGHATTGNEIKAVLKEGKMLPSDVLASKPRKYANERYVDVLAQYYASCLDNFVVFEDQLVPFPMVLETYRMRKISLERAANEILASPAYDHILVSFKQVNGISPKAESGTFYTDCSFAEDEKVAIIKNAFKCAINPNTMLKDSVVRNFTEFIDMAANNPGVYLSLLEFTEEYGITYAQLLRKFGLALPDYSEPYRLFGFVPICIGDVVILINQDERKTCSSKEFEERLKLLLFRLYKEGKPQNQMNVF